jgi:hypothetical protein
MAETPLTPATEAGAPVSGEPEATASEVLASEAVTSQEPVVAAPGEEPEAAAIEAAAAEVSEPPASVPPAAEATAEVTPVAAAMEQEPVATAVAAPVEVAPVEPAAIEPAVAATLEVPPLPGSSDTAGGEWDLLLSRVGEWLERTDLAGQWQRLQGPLRLLGLLILLVLVLRLYGALVGTLDSLPLVSGLLELVGVLAFGRFCVNRLVRSEERRRLQSQWSQRWRDFRGKA